VRALGKTALAGLSRFRQLTEALAQVLITKLNSTGHHAEVCERSRMKAAQCHDSLVRHWWRLPNEWSAGTALVRFLG